MKNLRISKILNKRCYSFVVALITSIIVCAHDGVTAWSDSVSIRIDSLLEDSIFRSSQVGICIYDLTDDTYIYRHNELQTMRPASTQKVITAITALKTVGVHHRMYTTVSYMGEIHSRTLYGDIYCKGSFDPMLNSNSIAMLAREVKAFGIDSIQGGLFIDRSMKDSLAMGSGWCWDDDNPSLSPLTVDGNDDFSSHMLSALGEAGVTINTYNGYGICPPEAIMIGNTYHTLENILPRMLKDSDNFYAEAMFYNLAASSVNRWATARDAAHKVEHLAEMLGHEKNEFRVADGSGLSLYNYTTPIIEVDFLRYAYTLPYIYNAIYCALPIAGVDGTLKKRMRDYPNTKGNVRAKTGSVSCVSSLAGYCKATNGHDIAFCIINQGMLRSKKARHFQDMVCAILCEPINTKLN